MKSIIACVVLLFIISEISSCPHSWPRHGSCSSWDDRDKWDCDDKCDHWGGWHGGKGNCGRWHEGHGGFEKCRGGWGNWQGGHGGWVGWHGVSRPGLSCLRGCLRTRLCDLVCNGKCRSHGHSGPWW